MRQELTEPVRRTTSVNLFWYTDGSTKLYDVTVCASKAYLNKQIYILTDSQVVLRVLWAHELLLN